MTLQSKLASFLSARGEPHAPTLSTNTILQAYFKALSYAEMDQFLTAVREARFGRLKSQSALKKQQVKPITERDKNRLKMILSRHQLLAQYAEKACLDERFVAFCHTTPLTTSVTIIQQAARLASANLLSEEHIASLQQPTFVRALQAISSFESFTTDTLKVQLETVMARIVSPIYMNIPRTHEKQDSLPVYVPYNPKPFLSRQSAYTTMNMPIYQNVNAVTCAEEPVYETVVKEIPTSNGYGYCEKPESKTVRNINFSQTGVYARLTTPSPIYENVMDVLDKKSKAYDSLSPRQKNIYASLSKAGRYENIVPVPRKGPQIYDSLVRTPHMKRNILYDAHRQYTPLQSNMSTCMTLHIKRRLSEYIESKIDVHAHTPLMVEQLLEAVSNKREIEHIAVTTFNKKTIDWPKGLLDGVIKCLDRKIYTESLVADFIEYPNLLDWVHQANPSELNMKAFVIQHANSMMALRKEAKEKESHYQSKLNTEEKLITPRKEKKSHFLKWISHVVKKRFKRQGVADRHINNSGLIKPFSKKEVKAPVI